MLKPLIQIALKCGNGASGHVVPGGVAWKLKPWGRESCCFVLIIPCKNRQHSSFVHVCLFSYESKSAYRVYCYLRTYFDKVTRSVRKVSSHFEYLENRSRCLDVTWQPVRGDLTAHPWTVTLPWV